MVEYDRTRYLTGRPDGTLRDATQALREITVCVFDGCEKETMRLNSSKCGDHRGICGHPGCGEVSMGDEKNFPRSKYKNGRDFRYCPFHTGRARNRKDLDAPRGKATVVVSLEEDPINFDKWDGTWSLSPAGYMVRYVQTIKGRSLTQQQHRIVIEEKLGRALERHENIHHKNGWTIDNRPENLELWDKSQTPGQRVADKIEWCKFYLGERGFVIEECGSWAEAETHVGWRSATHRMVMARELGRALYWHEIVARIDRDPENNYLENLELWTKSCPAGYEETEIVSWMREFLPQYGYRVVD